MPQLKTSKPYAEPRVFVARTMTEARSAWGPSDADGSVLHLIGNAAAFDQAAITFFWDADSASAHDGTNIIAPNITGAPTAGRWRKV